MPIDKQIAREKEESQRDNAKYEAAEAKENALEAKAKSAQSTLEAVKMVKDMIRETDVDEERVVYQETLKRLLSELDKQ